MCLSSTLHFSLLIILVHELPTFPWSWAVSSTFSTRTDLCSLIVLPGATLWRKARHTLKDNWTCCCCSVVSDSWTVAHQAPLSMVFPRQEYWIRLPFPSPGDLPNPVIEPEFTALTGRFFTTELPGKPRLWTVSNKIKMTVPSKLDIWYIGRMLSYYFMKWFSKKEY